MGSPQRRVQVMIRYPPLSLQTCPGKTNGCYWSLRIERLQGTTRFAIVAAEMKDELLRKIQHVLDRRITNEMQVVYLLVELRKLMDRDDYKDPVLRTFSNWVVHTSLENRSEGSTFILSEFDHFVAGFHERKRQSPHLQHISLGAFREALFRCFEHFRLSAKFVTDRTEWKKFGKLYCFIVSECPIVFTASKIRLKYIKQVELRGIAPGVLVKEWPIVQWRLTFHDGHTINWGFHMA